MSPLNVPPADPGNAIVAHTLHWLAVLLEIDEGEPGRIAAYRLAAQTVRRLDCSVAEVVRESGASGLERLGFTPVIAGQVSEWIRTGELPVLDQQRSHGLWPTLTRALCKTLGIEPAGKRPMRRTPRGPIHRQVWESWN